MANNTYKSTITFNKNIQVTAESRGMSFILDQPEADDEGITPVEALLSAIGACKAMMVRAYSRKHGIKVTSVQVEVEGDLGINRDANPDGPQGFTEIRTRYIFESDASDEVLKTFTDFIDQFCPVAATIKESPAMISRIERK